MYRKAAEQGKAAVFPINVENCGGNAADDGIVGGAQPHEQHLAVSLFWDKDACGLGYKYLENGNGKVAQVAVWKDI